MVRFEGLKLVDDCRWKSDEDEPFRPFTRTTNSARGILSTETKKDSLSWGCTTPTICPDPEVSTRATSVSVADSVPVRDRDNTPGAPLENKGKVFKSDSINYQIKLSSYPGSSPALGRVSRASNPPNTPVEFSTKSSRKSIGLSPANIEKEKRKKLIS